MAANHHWRVITLVLLLLAGRPSSAQNIPKEWASDVFTSVGTNDYAVAIEQFDDGTGSAVYIGGEFTQVGNLHAKGIAKWNGTSWSSVGGGVDGSVIDMLTFDDGTGTALYVAGDFTRAGGRPANRIAKWDGIAWTSMGTGFTDAVRVLSIYDDGSGPALYAGGNFTDADGQTANYIARWNGTTWEPPGFGNELSNGYVRALCVCDLGDGPELIAGGIFSLAGIDAIGIARWNGVSWTPVADIPGIVTSLAQFNDGTGESLYAGGRFRVSGNTFEHLYKWTPDGVETIPGAPDSEVYSLYVDSTGSEDRLIVGGTFPSAGGVAASLIAAWDGTSWSSVGLGMDGGNSPLVRRTQICDVGDGATLFAVGEFETAGGNETNNVAAWDGVNWNRLGEFNSVNATVHALIEYDDGNGSALFVGGAFTRAGELATGGVAKWENGVWEPVGGGVAGVVRTFHIHNDGTGEALYVGGDFDMAGNLPVQNIAKWDGQSWQSVGAGMNGTVRTLVTYHDRGNPALYAGGNFTMAGNRSANNIAKWDGQQWTPLGPGTNGPVFALGIHINNFGTPMLLVGGNFQATVENVMNVAAWNGFGWTPLLGGVNGIVRAFELFPDSTGNWLFAGGDFTQTHLTPADRTARWNGLSWLDAGDGLASNGAVRVLYAFDDGTGRRLYCGGNMGETGHGDVRFIAEYDGVGWNQLEQSISGPVNAMASYDDGTRKALYVGGEFRSAGGKPSRYLARWDYFRDPSFGDFDRDGDIDLTDYAAFALCFNGSMTPPATTCHPGADADLDGDGDVDTADFAIFAERYTGSR